MEEIQYKKFSWDTHKKNWELRRPNVCQFELTFGCGLDCNYCYTSCYNKPEYIKDELETEEVKSILDKVYDIGVIWLCFTGGDPLTRGDFLDIYSYAKDKGFIITIFTNGYSMTKETADYFREKTPFVIEITLNAVTRESYEKISGIKDSFEKTMRAIDMILGKGLPLKIKTQVTKDNLEGLDKIKEFVEKRALSFRPTPFIHARLNGDVSPCLLRIDLQQASGLNEEDRCKSIVHSPQSIDKEINEQNNNLFHCAITGGDGIHIDPYGNLIPCLCIREPKINLLRKDIKSAHSFILDWVRNRKYSNGHKCKSCTIRNKCYNCPGKALLETGDLEGRVEWFCETVHKESIVHSR